MNEARKRRDQARTLLLSTILADLKNRELELHHPASDDEAVEILRRGIKRRREAAEPYVAAARPELPHRELAEVKKLEEFPPAGRAPGKIRPPARGGIA